MKIYLFPGQGSQFEGMGQSLHESGDKARELFELANDILGYNITQVMLQGTAEDLKQTKITQPAVFLHSVIRAKTAGDDFQPDAVAGHSLGEFSALVASGVLSFENGLRLVHTRALAMQKACELIPSTMAAVIGLEDEQVVEICAQIDDVVVPANFNCPGQLVISGTLKGVEEALARLTEAGARKAVVLEVSGAFHSPLMEPARGELQMAIDKIDFRPPICPIYQNVTALPQTDPEEIKQNLIAQLTQAVRWTQTMQNMIRDGATEFVEVGGNGKVLRGLIRRIDRTLPANVL